MTRCVVLMMAALPLAGCGKGDTKPTVPTKMLQPPGSDSPEPGKGVNKKGKGDNQGSSDS